MFFTEKLFYISLNFLEMFCFFQKCFVFTYNIFRPGLKDNDCDTLIIIYVLLSLGILEFCLAFTSYLCFHRCCEDSRKGEKIETLEKSIDLIRGKVG